MQCSTKRVGAAHDTFPEDAHLTGTMIGYVVHSTATAAAALTRSLMAIVELLERTGDETYLWKPPGGVSGSIGAHVRHVLDHVDVLTERPRPQVLSYDYRVRNTRIEQSRLAGIAALQLAAARLDDLTDGPVDQVLTLEAMLEHGQAPVAVTTSLARELVFALQHTIHHQAIIAVLLQQVGVRTPARFGYAPATPTDEDRCARSA
jgi:uncharacterized damage-inducible protein DinB